MKSLRHAVLLALGTATVFLTGCLGAGNVSKADEDRTGIEIRAALGDVNKTTQGGLGKSAVITLDRLIVTLISSSSADSVIRDTIVADTGSFVSDASVDQSFTRAYTVRPMRNWTVVVKSLDVNDSVIHYDSVVATNILLGQTRVVNLNLASRYVMYEAKFTVPDSLRSSQTGLAQGINITRFVMVVDGDTVADSSAVPRFTPTPGSGAAIVHTVRYDYINAATTPDVLLQFFGSVDGVEEETLLFEHLFENVNPNDPSPIGAAPQYVGPGSDGTGGAVVGMTVNIGKVGTVVFETEIPGDVF